MRQPAIILIVIGIIVLFIGAGGASILSISSTPNYLPTVETVTPGGTSANPTVLTSPTFQVSVSLIEEDIYGNTATQSDVVIGTVVVTNVSVSVDGINKNVNLTASFPSQWGGIQEYFNTSITLPTQIFSGPITYYINYYDDMDTGATPIYTATYGGYLALNSGEVTSLTITGYWTINGVVVTGPSQIINLTTTQINVYYINTQGGQYIASEFLYIAHQSQAGYDVPLSKLSNGTWFASFTLQPGTYNVYGDINTTEGGLQTMELFGSYGPPAPQTATPYLSTFIGAYQLEIIVVGVILIIIGLLLMRV